MTDTSETQANTTAEPSQRDDPRVVASLQRLDRMEGFLREDPSNNSLLITAFEAALSCGEWERAELHLRRAHSLSEDVLGWRLREGDFWLAQQRYDEALSVLDALTDTQDPPPGFLDVLMHNIAFIELRRGRHAECVARLASVLEAGSAASASQTVTGQPPVAARALQQLWLRALHHDRQLDRAMEWTLGAEQQRTLDPQAAGVASLIAIDASNFEAAQRWCVLSLSNGTPPEQPVEAFVTRATLALAQRDAAAAGQFADAALQRHPGDGRAWSTRGFASLLAGDLGNAFRAFRQALSVMGQHIGTWHGLGWTQILQGDLAGAHESFETALALDRNFAESHGGLAVVLAMQGRPGEAGEHAELALRLDRANMSGRYAQALLTGDVKDASDVQRFARRILGGIAAPLGGDLADLVVAPGAKANG
ncbi:hypothetical protein PMI12_03922 [Variovorax sp. CF313]|uniref:tetratricopeptide repeat protein n=1 Tax=Variovorax sp. CF313 TaxID=1144315 RepID=UPI000271463A|nr:tetratricopeptide repeat protein [Variovorax sp. CF313]EJL72181.1 hypothetical protein PMI12_03922 [Variovorax sp. CF313]